MIGNSRRRQALIHSFVPTDHCKTMSGPCRQTDSTQKSGDADSAELAQHSDGEEITAPMGPESSPPSPPQTSKQSKQPSQPASRRGSEGTVLAVIIRGALTWRGCCLSTAVSTTSIRSRQHSSRHEIKCFSLCSHAYVFVYTNSASNDGF